MARVNMTFHVDEECVQDAMDECMGNKSLSIMPDPSLFPPRVHATFTR